MKHEEKEKEKEKESYQEDANYDIANQDGDKNRKIESRLNNKTDVERFDSSPIPGTRYNISFSTISIPYISTFVHF